MNIIFIRLQVGQGGFDTQHEQRKGFFLFATHPDQLYGTTQPSIEWELGGLSPRVNWPGCEADHSPPSNADVKNVWNYTFTSQYVFMA
jgi:hypothetical protein